MKKILIVLVCLGMVGVATACFADKIYLKSGEVVQGKLKKVEKLHAWDDDWCTGQDNIQLWEDLNGRCISESSIERLEKEFRPPEGVALLANDDNWGEPKYGYSTQLIPASKVYTRGEPMLFHLVLKNVSGSLKWYDSQGVRQNTLLIIGPDGKEVNYKRGQVMTAGAEQPIDTGEIVILFENRNIAKEYTITIPGHYTIKFREGDYGLSAESIFHASNIVEFEVTADNNR